MVFDLWESKHTKFQQKTNGFRHLGAKTYKKQTKTKWFSTFWNQDKQKTHTNPLFQKNKHSQAISENQNKKHTHAYTISEKNTHTCTISETATHTLFQKHKHIQTRYFRKKNTHNISETKKHIHYFRNKKLHTHIIFGEKQRTWNKMHVKKGCTFSGGFASPEGPGQAPLLRRGPGPGRFHMGSYGFNMGPDDARIRPPTIQLGAVGPGPGQAK